ncbi:conjugative transposon protein TraM [Luteirhabdus pelagi]|uniref:conjugative transposon protein TraM n=1 Tax=Luteirhabdus pelagi TaxID=2792783 RepID=UPI001939B515|nr:conjugative transposon protein TraM [Luteirhabdus pelagi]
MKIEKNKIVFISVLLVLFTFIISYAVMMMGEEENKSDTLHQTLIPELDENQKEYDSKLDAINDLKEVRESTAPSIYDEKLLDSTGLYNPNLPEQEKERIVDSIYKANRIHYSGKSTSQINRNQVPKKQIVKIDSSESRSEQGIKTQEIGLEHQLFFAAAPKVNESKPIGKTDETILVLVDGDQVVKANSRLRMRLAQNAKINGKLIPKNTSIFGFISFQPNRALIEIENINHQPTKLKAFDLQDGSEGIYVENNFRAEATDEIVDDVVDQVNIPSLPQISGITKVFRRNNRKVKITVVNNYRLILKPRL